MRISKLLLSKIKKKSILKLSSEKPVLDPFLDLLIQIDSPKGRNFREYTVLLDPLPASQSQVESLVEPEPAPPPETSTETETETKSEPEEPATKPEPVEPATKPEPVEPATKPEPVEPATKPEPERKAKMVVSKNGVTLYQIARDNKLEGVTLQQIVVGIYQTNPKAFANNNINGLEVGNKLTLPSKAYYNDLSHVDATKILKKDNDSWGSIKNKKKVVKPAEPIKEVKPAEPIKEVKPAEPIKEVKPAEPIKEVKPAEPIKEVKPAEPIKEVKPAEPIKEVKPAEPIKEVTIKEPSVEIDTKTFKSSISSADDNITEVIIKDKEEGSLTTLHMLLLALLLGAIIGLLIILSRKKRQASLLFDENLEQNSSTQTDHEEISNKSSESSKPTDRYIASMNKTNKE